MSIYSHSKLSTYEQCPKKYEFQYIDKIEIKEKPIEAFLGNKVHEALEWLYNNVNEKIPEIDDLIIYYSNNWQSDYEKEKYTIVRELKVEDYFNMGIKFLLDYYTSNYPFKENTLETEKQIFVDLTDFENQEMHKLIGFIDRLVHNLESDEIEIHDYKTSGTLPSKEKINEDRQLALYSIAIKTHEKFKGKRIKLIWHYLAFNQKIIIEKKDDELEKLKQDTIKTIKIIEMATIDNNFPTKKSPLCDWCSYKNICPAWKNQYDNKDNKTKNNDKEKYPTILKYLRD